MSADATVMLASTLDHAFRALRRSLWSQLLVLAAATLLLGPGLVLVNDIAGVRVAGVIAAIGALVAVCASSALATRALEPGRMLRALAGAAVGSVPAVGAVVSFWTAATVHPLLGFLVLPVATVLVSLSVAPMLWGIGEGSRSARTATWKPAGAYAAVRSSGVVRVSFVACIAASLCLLASLPIALAGFLLMALLGPVGSIGMGVALAAWIPGMGALACSMRREIASTDDGAQDAGLVEGASAFGALLGLDVGAPVAAREIAVAPPTTAPPAGPPGAPATPLLAVPAGWSRGMAWDVTLDAGAMWGEWFSTPTPTELAVRCAWSNGSAPELAICDSAGVWVALPTLAESGHATRVNVPAGAFHLRATAPDGVPRAMRIEVLLPTPAVA